MTAFLIGFSVGVVGGLIMAPKPGRYYRDIVDSKALENLAHKAADLRETASGAVDKGRNVVAHSIERIACPTPPGVYQR
jgi:hypothetical protein